MPSKAFETYKKVADSVRNDVYNVNRNKEKIVTISSLIPSTQKNGDQVFYLNAKDESLQFTISPGGVLKTARYIDKTADEGQKGTFLAKDYDKMLELVKHATLKKFASELNWEKAPAKEDASVEQVIDEPAPEM